MKLHVVTRSVYGVGLAFQAEQRGMATTLHVDGCGNLGRRTETVLPKYQPDAIVLDGIGFGELAKECEANGIRVYFGGKWAELMAADDGFYRAMIASWGFSQDVEPHADGAIPVAGFWYDGEAKAPFFNGTIYTRLCAGNVGPIVEPVMATVAPCVRAALLQEMGEHLRGSGYRGLVVVAFNANHEPYGVAIGPHPMLLESVAEMTVGGLPALMSETGGVSGGDCAVAVRVSTWPWPLRAQSSNSCRPIELDAGALKHFWPHEVILDEGVMTVADGASVGTVTARGRDVQEAMRRASRTLRAFNADGFQYRTDTTRA